MKRLSIVALFLVLPVLAQDLDPASALDQAKARIAERRYEQAVSILTPGLRAAAAIGDESVRGQALAAMHFYLAVAQSGLRKVDAARTHLREFARLSPDSRTIDPKKFDARFVALFQEEISGPGGSGDEFETYYPAWRGFSAQNDPATDAAAVHLLGSAEERRTWASLPDLEKREAFMTRFWAARAEAGKEAAARESFGRRVAFADEAFAAAGQRGAFSDRGKVFVLLGRPSFVRRRPIRSEDQVLVTEEAMINGSVEQWLYQRADLPVAIGSPSVTYRFISQAGVGFGMLQKESAQSMRVLAEAAARQRPE